MRGGSEAVAEGHVEGPEDLVYDAATGVLYTGCKDGWIKRVTVKESVADSVVESLVRIEGRPLGLALDKNGELIVADSDRVTRKCKNIQIQRYTGLLVIGKILRKYHHSKLQNSDNFQGFKLQVVYISHNFQGLVRVRIEGKMVELLTDEVEGLKFKITNGVDVAEDGTVYFTDVSHKYNEYNEGDSLLGILEGRHVADS